LDELIAQIRAASASGLYYLALLGALALPDICGALASADGQATGAKYKDWLRANVPEEANNADAIYRLRCSLVHQGSAMRQDGYPPLAFTHPTAGVQLHSVRSKIDGATIDWISIPHFIDDVTRGVEAWFAQFGETADVKRNLERFARFRPEGLPPVVNVPVIA
jgi:hypothetical protein